MKKQESTSIIAKNGKASFNYFLSDFLECGIVLKGTEIKSLRKNGATLGDAYIIFSNGEAFILNMHISPYEKGNIFNHNPLRTRKLLLHKDEIRKMAYKADAKGYSVVPTKIYFVKGRAKVEIALAKGKKLYDKRETIKAKDNKREIEKAMKGFKNGQDY